VAGIKISIDKNHNGETKRNNCLETAGRLKSVANTRFKNIKSFFQ
jgi:hypothetical protein